MPRLRSSSGTSFQRRATFREIACGAFSERSPRATESARSHRGTCPGTRSRATSSASILPAVDSRQCCWCACQSPLNILYFTSVSAFCPRARRNSRSPAARRSQHNARSSRLLKLRRSGFTMGHRAQRASTSMDWGARLSPMDRFIRSSVSQLSKPRNSTSASIGLPNRPATGVLPMARSRAIPSARPFIPIVARRSRWRRWYPATRFESESAVQRGVAPTSRRALAGCPLAPGRSLRLAGGSS